VKDEFSARSLPHHPLEAQGYLSIGCITCTDRVCPGEDQRAGRWRGREKTECGIHLSITSARDARLLWTRLVKG
jgi:phosphoadenosine phosphosulfate reductase